MIRRRGGAGCGTHFIAPALVGLTLLQCTGASSSEQVGISTLVRNALADSAIAWRSINTARFVVHAPRATVSDDSLAKLSRAVEQAATAALQQLHADSVPAAHIFFVATPADLARLAGGPGGGRTDVAAGAIFYVLPGAGNPPLRHELAHLITWRNWGEPHAYWISEGAAVYGARFCEGHDLHEWAAALAQENRLVALTALETDFDFASAPAHLQAGSFVQYVDQKLSDEALHALWREGVAGVSRVSGRSVADLEQDWLAEIGRLTVVDRLKQRTGRIRCE